jgi:hypothetical protein
MAIGFCVTMSETFLDKTCDFQKISDIFAGCDLWHLNFKLVQ